MFYIYTAIFTPMETGSGYYAKVPDLPGCITTGKDIADTICSLITADTIEYRARTDNHSVRKNVSLPCWMVNLADKRGINCSQVLQDALRTILDTPALAKPQ